MEEVGDSPTINDLKKVTRKSSADLINDLPEIIHTLVKIEDRKYHRITIPQCFLGNDLVDAIMQHMKFSTRAEAVGVAKFLMQKGVFRSALVSKQSFEDKKRLYTFQKEKIGELTKSKDAEKEKSPSLFIGELQVKVLEGTGMFPRKVAGHARLFTKFILDGSNFKTKSITVHGSDKGTIRFDHTASLFNFHSNCDLTVELWKKHAHSRKHNTQKGEVVIPLFDLPVNEEVDKWYTIKEGDIVRGQLHLILKYSFIYGNDDGSYPHKDYWPIHWVSHDPAVLRKAEASTMHRCGIADIFPVVTKPIPENQEVIGLTLSGPTSFRESADEVDIPKIPISRRIQGVFEHGFVKLPSNTPIDFYVQKNPPHGEFVKVASDKTDGGKVSFDVPTCILHEARRYPIRMVVANKPSEVALGSVFVIEKGTRAVVFDIDGTLTVGDQEFIKQLALDTFSVTYSPNPRRGAAAVVRWWFAKGYLIVYLSGRQGSAYSLTREWLQKHGFPPGIIGHTFTHMPTMPVYSIASLGVGDFKADFMKAVVAAGAVFEAVYGNTITDIRCYDEVKIPKDSTYIVGPLGGKEGTVAVGDDFTKHFAELHNKKQSPVPLCNTPEW